MQKPVVLRKRRQRVKSSVNWKMFCYQFAKDHCKVSFHRCINHLKIIRIFHSMACLLRKEVITIERLLSKKKNKKVFLSRNLLKFKAYDWYWGCRVSHKNAKSIT